jgi:DNA-binding CsgD family transcriptional regulator
MSVHHLVEGLGCVPPTLGAASALSRGPTSKHDLLQRMAQFGSARALRRAATESFPAVFDADACVIQMTDVPFDPSRADWFGIPSYFPAYLQAKTLPPNPLFDFVVRYHEPTHSLGAMTEREWHGQPLCVQNMQVLGLDHTMLCPLLWRGTLAGTLHLGRAKGRPPFTDRQLLEVFSLATHLSTMMAGLPSDPDPGKTTELTDREREVAEHASRGCSNRQIGILLAVSENTVKKHLKRVFAKLGTQNRVELALAWNRGATSGLDRRAIGDRGRVRSST